MLFADTLSYYDLLEIRHDAAAPEIRSAYLKAKMAYRKDSVATYTLVSDEETDQLLKLIEEAYQTLSHPEKRLEYDRQQGFAPQDHYTPQVPRGLPTPSPTFLDEDPFAQIPSTASSPETGRPTTNIVSIDRVPPMESGVQESELFNSPTTDFTIGKMELPKPNPAPNPTPFDQRGPQPPTTFTQKNDPLRVFSTPVRHSTQDQEAQNALLVQIQEEKDWSGGFLRHIREIRRISIEELAEYTKISKSYLTAIEDENFPRLPASVYLRGFLTQVSKFLKIPSEVVAAAYLARYHAWKGSKNERTGT